MTIRIARYNAALADDWARVLASAKNGIFQFDRQFIEYHGERFVDMSAVAYIDERPVAIIPAAFDPQTSRVSSHPGLTFGGPVFVRELRGDTAIGVIEAMLDTFRDWGATSCLVKLLPEEFATYPSAEAAYALWRKGFQLIRRDLSSLLPLHDGLPFNELKRRAVKKARKHGLVVTAIGTDTYHDLLTQVLQTQYATQPVHSKAELALLKDRFPQNILARGATIDGRLLAGTLVFNYGHVWHTQYLASSDEGRSLGALDLVISELIEEAKAAGASSLSFGTSTVANGQELNQGLLWQKESYGARALVHDFIEGPL
ncbi:MAG: GNAT family N-acetyltransferase [Xanthomonadales bacterium]|nr:GNAT family N-acetyltransferase [Xanthomonadales bacterium]